MLGFFSSVLGSKQTTSSYATNSNSAVLLVLFSLVLKASKVNNFELWVAYSFIKLTVQSYIFSEENITCKCLMYNQLKPRLPPTDKQPYSGFHFICWDASDSSVRWLTEAVKYPGVRCTSDNGRSAWLPEMGRLPSTKCHLLSITQTLRV